MSDGTEKNVGAGGGWLAILRLVGKYAPSVFAGIGELVEDIENQGKTGPVSESTVLRLAQNRGVPLHAVAQYAEANLVHK